VIPAHNAESTISVQLTALVNQLDAPPFEVIVVANRCADGTAAAAASFSGQLDLRLVVANDMAGASYARNAGVAEAAGPLILHCDADDQVDQRWVRSLVDALDVFDIAGGALRVPAGDEGWFSDAELHDRDDLYTSRGVRYGLTSCLGYRKDVHDKVGGFDVRFRLGADDVVFCLRASNLGYEIGFAEAARVEYRPRATAREAIRQRYRYGQGEALLHVHYMPDQLRSVQVEVISGARAILRSGLHGVRRSRRRAESVRVAYLVGRTLGYVRLAGAGEWPKRRST